MESYVSSQVARKRLGVSNSTLRRWADDGVIRVFRAPGRNRLYDVSELLRQSKERAPSSGPDGTMRRRIAYCRVSSNGQKDDLARQVEHMRSLLPEHTVVTDVGSGINFRRKGLRSILELASRGHIEEVVVAHRDRLCRFAFELVEWVLSLHGARLVVLDQTLGASPDAELAEDLLAIVNVFSCRVNGRRKYTAKRTSEDP